MLDPDRVEVTDIRSENENSNYGTNVPCARRFLIYGAAARNEREGLATGIILRITRRVDKNKG